MAGWALGQAGLKTKTRKGLAALILAANMNRAESKAGQVDAAVLELAEAVELEARVGETFEGTVTDYDRKRGARIQICDPAIITRVPVNDARIGAPVRLLLDEADPAQRLTRFSVVNAAPDPPAPGPRHDPLRSAS